MNQTKFLQARLISDCKKNDRKAQLQLYDMYCNAMYNTAYNFVKDSAVAEDMTQEGFIKAFQNIDAFNEKVTFGAWLKRIVINNCLDWLKKRKLTVVAINDTNVQVAQEDNWQVDESISMLQIQEAIETLPEKYRVVIKLYLLEGYDHEEISEILTITEVNSRSLLFRGKNKLKELLKNYQYA